MSRRETSASRRLAVASTPARAVLSLCAAMVVASVLLAVLVLPRLGVGPADRWLPWWALGLLFAGAEAFVLHIQVRREARSLSLSDFALVVGLYLATPTSLVLGRLVFPLAVLALVRRQPPLKLAFNAALLLLESLTALVVFEAVAGSSPLGPRAWVAALAAAAACAVLSAGLVTGVIALHEQRPTARDWARAVVSSVGMSVLVATPSLVAVESLTQDRRSIIMLIVCAASLFFGYRAYANLNERHLGLERLYGFSRRLHSAGTDAVVRNLLREAQELLRGEVVEISLLGRDGEPGNTISVTKAGVIRTETQGDLTPGDWLWARVVDEGEPLLMPRASRDAAVRRYLERRGWRDAVVVPMRGESGVVGTLTIANRLGDVRSFDEADARLLATVANQASVALENGRLIDRLRHDALHDALTGLPNRLMFRESLIAALEDVAPDRGVAAMILDLDGFKEINDTLGHQYGDLVLVALATRLRAVVGEDGLVARLGGDEFAVLLTDLPDEEIAVATARCLVQSLEEPVHFDNMNLEVGGSVGIAVCFDYGENESDLLKHADLAMYAAKNEAARVALFHPALDSSSPARLALLSGLRQAIVDGDLHVFVQPKARMDSRQVDCVEALVRWRHRERGILGPDEFVPLAERSGLIRPLTSFVLRTAIRDAARWLRSGIPVGVAVNVSARSLLDPDLVGEIESILALHRLPASMLTLEITESCIMADPARTAGVLDRLDRVGVRLSVDDFGTGYSSLTYLKSLPVCEVKIDRSFIAGLSFDESDAAIVRSVVDLGANLGLEVVAEGVEDEVTWRKLAASGCDIAQGYHLGRPMPIEDFPGWLESYEAARPAGPVDRLPTALGG